jgi:hypothetical protein
MGDIILTWLVGGIYIAIRSGYDWTKENVFGIKDVDKKEIKKREKKLLYKKIRLIKNQKIGLQRGLNGIVLEVIDKKSVFAEFYDLNGKKIERNNNTVFKIGIQHFKMTN